MKNMTTFAEIEYVRPNVDAMKVEMENYIELFKNATTFEEAEKALLDGEKVMKTFMTDSTIANIRGDINSADEFYEGEIRFFNDAQANMIPLMIKQNEALVNTPFKADFIAKYGDVIFSKAEADLKTMSPDNVEDMVKESDLVLDYSKLVATQSVEFNGEDCNFYGLLKHMESTDRETRRCAFFAFAKMYEDIAPEMDEIYSKLCVIRSNIAKRVGFSNYQEYSYLSNYHFDYTADDVAKFRKAIKEVVTPVCQQLIDKQALSLGVEKVKFYDEKLIFPNGNANPIGTKDELLAKTKTMYEAMSKETKEFFDFMYERQLFDLETKPNKRMGGYCTELPDYEAPFIFSNFNGTLGDVEVLTHEAGHCFNAYLSMRNNPLMAMTQATMETCEIHSMSMELFSYPWWNTYFEENEAKAKYAHMATNLMVLPYMACVDEYQHGVYANPTMTADERYALWSKIEKEYMPWRDYDGNEFFGKGGFWLQKQHIFMFPFYYIDYALAQMSAFEFYGKMQENHENAWNDYVTLCGLGGSKNYLELLKTANLTNPFSDGFVEKAVGYVKGLVL